MKNKNAIAIVSLVFLGAFLVGCNDEIAPDKKTQDLMNQQRAAMSGSRGGAPTGGAPGAAPAGGSPGGTPNLPTSGPGAPTNTGGSGR